MANYTLYIGIGFIVAALIFILVGIFGSASTGRSWLLGIVGVVLGIIGFFIIEAALETKALGSLAGGKSGIVSSTLAKAGL